MKIYILERVYELTDNCHSSGGLVVIAESIDSAKKLLSADKNIKISEEEWAEAEVFEINSSEEKYYIMPDQGCC